MKRAELLSWLAVGLLAVYSILLGRSLYGFSQERWTPEVFPFFVWELFSRVPQDHQVDYAVRLVEMDGTALAEPTYFERSTLPLHQAGPAQAMLGVIGRAYEGGDQDRLDRYREIWESRYLEPLTTATYELVRREYTVEGRHECECFTRETVLATFTMGEP